MNISSTYSIILYSYLFVCVCCQCFCVYVPLGNEQLEMTLSRATRAEFVSEHLSSKSTSRMVWGQWLLHHNELDLVSRIDPSPQNWWWTGHMFGDCSQYLGSPLIHEKSEGEREKKQTKENIKKEGKSSKQITNMICRLQKKWCRIDTTARIADHRIANQRLEQISQHQGLAL